MQENEKLTIEEVHDTDKQFAEDILHYLKKTGNIENLTANNVYDVIFNDKELDDFDPIHPIMKVINVLETPHKIKFLNKLIDTAEKSLNLPSQYYEKIKKQIDPNYDGSESNLEDYFVSLLKIRIMGLNDKFKLENLNSTEKGELLINELFKN